MLPQKLGQANGPQKVLAFALMIATAFGGMWVFNKYLAPFFIDFFTNVWKLAFIGGPLVLIALYWISNPLVVWGFFTTLSRKFTSFLIKMDPLSVMDRYIDLLIKKYDNLQRTIEIVKGKKIKLDRRIDELNAQKQGFLERGQAALKIQNKSEASTQGAKAAAVSSTIKALSPIKVRVDASLKILETISEALSQGIEKYKFEVSNKRAEFEIIKETFKGLKSAEEFINSNSEGARLYGESILALEEDVTQKIGYIEEFERRSKSVINDLSIDKQVTEDKGLAELEAFMNEKLLDLTPIMSPQPVIIKQNSQSKFDV